MLKQGHTITITLTPQQREAVDELRARLGLTDEEVIFGGLYKLAAFVETDVDPEIFSRRRQNRS